MIELRAVPGKTGRLLRQMLGERGLIGGPVQGVVNYGYGGSTDLPQLNGRAGTFNKYEELLLLADAELPVPFVSTWRLALSTNMLGRRFHHTRGKDIRVNGPGDYYTQLIPKRREFRVWAYRRKCIGVYEKILRYPRKNGRRGRSREIWNWKNGYAFEFRHPASVAGPVRELGRGAVEALGLDFGAADIIESNSGHYYVLEVNSAPGVEGPRQALTSLVNHIERWARGGFKKRRGDGESCKDGAVPRRALL